MRLRKTEVRNPMTSIKRLMTYHKSTDTLEADAGGHRYFDFALSSCDMTGRPMMEEGMTKLQKHLRAIKWWPKENIEGYGEVYIFPLDYEVAIRFID